MPRSALIALLLGACTGDLMDRPPEPRPDPGIDAASPPPGVDAAPGVPDAAPMPLQDGGTLAQRPCPPDSFLSYANFGGPFMTSYCTGCHSSQVPPAMRHDAPEGVDFETLEGVRMHMDKIYMQAADYYSVMPPAGGPHPEDRMLLGEWLACGAPE